jgi:methyl acetate hydrolase
MASDGRLDGPLDDLLSDAVRRGVAAGFVAVVADRDGERYLGTAGSMTAGEDRPVTADTVFRIASMTKPLVTVGALQLVETGRLGLDDEVASILPAFAELQVLDGFDADTPVLRLSLGAGARPTRDDRHDLLPHAAGARAAHAAA